MVGGGQRVCGIEITQNQVKPCSSPPAALTQKAGPNYHTSNSFGPQARTSNGRGLSVAEGLGSGPALPLFWPVVLGKLFSHSEPQFANNQRKHWKYSSLGSRFTSEEAPGKTVGLPKTSARGPHLQPT